MQGSIRKGYRILDQIKEGSVGTVWRAKDKANRVVALKQISHRKAQASGKLKQFKKEAQLTGTLRHPRIIRVYEYVPSKPLPFFTMEYFGSESLKYSIRHMPGRVNGREFVVLLQIAQALNYVHNQGIIHKDIKPENVLIAPNSEIRLIDFSLAQTKIDRMMQFRKRVEGTPMYMAPEQIRGERCDARTDIYSFGLLMYEVLTKQFPFVGTSETDLLNKHLRQPAPSMKTHIKTISSDLDRLVLGMLAKRAADRVEDMTTVIFELSKWHKKDKSIREMQIVRSERMDPVDAPAELMSSTVA